jgi:hypothetical protein
VVATGTATARATATAAKHRPVITVIISVIRLRRKARRNLPREANRLASDFSGLPQ